MWNVQSANVQECKCAKMRECSAYKKIINFAHKMCRIWVFPSNIGVKYIYDD